MWPRGVLVLTRRDGARSGSVSRRSARWILVLALLLAIVFPVIAEDVQQTRTRAGLRFFRTLLSADLGITGKTVDDGRLLLLVYYADDRRSAEELAATLRGSTDKKHTIKGLPLVVEVTADAGLAAYAARKPAGVFLSQAPERAALGAIIRYGIDNHVIVYSPFEGHVEHGVLGGISIEAQVRPYLNLTTLEASRISLKKLVVEVSKVTQ